jgi:hypothetical protein
VFTVETSGPAIAASVSDAGIPARWVWAGIGEIPPRARSDSFLAGGPLKNYLFAQPGWREIDNQRMRTLLDDLGRACARTLGKPSA